MRGGAHAAKLVMDPMHGFINIREYPVVGEIVETGHFQRLRRVGQLGLAHLVYPSATHTRFAHSLGTMRTFLALYDAITGGGGAAARGGGGEEEEARELGAAAALLHDIGHGPFSHAFESVMRPAGFDHEEMALRIVAETEIGDILDSHGVGASDVRNVLGGKEEGGGGGGMLGTVRRLISSQLDADRLDYLVRDSYFTGVNYGKIDLLRIANTLESEPDGRIVVSERGIGAVEGYVVGRYLMYKNVYYHRTVRQMECVLERAFARAAEIGAAETGLDELADPAAGPPGPGAMLGADDNTAMALIGRWARSDDAVLRDLASRVAGRRGLAHRSVPRAEMEGLEADESRMGRLRGSFEAAGLPAEYYLIVDSESKPAYTRYEPSGRRSGVDEGGDEDILVHRDGGGGGEGGGRLAEISSISAVVGALVQGREGGEGGNGDGGEGGDVRLFYPHKMSGAVDAALGRRR